MMKILDRLRIWNARRKWWKVECKPYKSSPVFEITFNLFKKDKS